MLLYNLRIAVKSLRRNPLLTALVIGAIALGICVATSFVALRHMLAKDPLPDGGSKELFYVRIDTWDPARSYLPEDPTSLPKQITYRDARELLKSTIPTRQTASFESTMFVHPDPKVGRPYSETVRMIHGDFFAMFRVPFLYGSGWDRAADAKPEQVVVIDKATNEKLFGGANSIGRSVRIEERDYKVVGVLDDWRPSLRIYDPASDIVSPPEAIYLPFNLTPLAQVRSSGNMDGWKGNINTFEELLESETSWLQYWVELPTVEQQRAYKDALNAYVLEQKKLGRIQRPLNTRVTSMIDLLAELKVVPAQITAMSTVSLLFLAVCSLNLVGLLLGKFLARIPEVSVRRALGASRAQVFWQHIVECELVGIAGGAIGLVLSIGVLELMSKFMPYGMKITLDAEMVAISIFLSLIAGLLAGVYPAWRVCTVPPAMQLKVQ